MLTIFKNYFKGWRDGSAIKEHWLLFQEVFEFYSQQPTGGSQQSTMRSGPPFWHVGISAGRTL